MTGRRVASIRGFGSGRGSGGRGSGNNGGRGDNDGSGGRGDTHGSGFGGHGGGASASGESSAAGARGGRSRGARGGGLRRLRDVYENSECVLWDHAERQILPLGVDADQGSGGRGSGNGVSGGTIGNSGPGANDGSGGRGTNGQGSGNNGGRGANDGSGGRGDTRGSGVGGHGGGASGSGESSAVGARGGRSGGARGGGRRRDEDENSECVLWDHTGRQILPVGEDADPRSHRTRGYSPGGFGIYPETPIVVRIYGNLIDCPKALRNLLAIIRMFWPDGCVGVKEIDRTFPKFWDDCIDEFLRYFTWNPEFATEDEARASILAVLRDKLRRALSDDKKRADEQKKSGGTYAEHRPLYMKPGVWSRIAKYWESDEFKKRSDAGKKARKSVKVPHTSGARSFDRRRRDYVEKHGKLNTLDVYKDCHTYLEDSDRLGQWITKAAKDIIDHYISICEKKGVDPETTQIHSWIEAVGGVRKNTIIGHPRLRPSDVYGSDAHPPPRNRKGEGSSGRSTLARLQDDMFLRVVDETLAQARANPDEYTLTAEEVRLLARNVLEGDSSVPLDHPVARETRQAIIRVAVVVLNSIYKKDGPGAVKGKAQADDDVENGDPGDDDTESDQDHDMSAMPHVSHGGPKIRG